MLQKRAPQVTEETKYNRKIDNAQNKKFEHIANL
jgi:hypothetical protein